MSCFVPHRHLWSPARLSSADLDALLNTAANLDRTKQPNRGWFPLRGHRLALLCTRADDTTLFIECAVRDLGGTVTRLDADDWLSSAIDRVPDAARDCTSGAPVASVDRRRQDGAWRAAGCAIAGRTAPRSAGSDRVRHELAVDDLPRLRADGWLVFQARGQILHYAVARVVEQTCAQQRLAFQLAQSPFPLAHDRSHLAMQLGSIGRQRLRIGSIEPGAVESHQDLARHGGFTPDTSKPREPGVVTLMRVLER